MRLAILERGHRRRARLFLRLGRLLGGGEVDDVIKTVLYRPEFFGRALSRAVREALRGPSEWTPGERELLAAHVSRLNECPFCQSIHSQTARLGMQLDSEPDLAEWQSGSFGPKVTASMELLAAVARRPTEVSKADIDRVRAAGVSDSAIEDALRVAFLFNVLNRLANALDYSYGTEASRLRQAGALHRFGYRIPRILMT
jgi:uncharacterized peroxidase-related enzyme